MSTTSSLSAEISRNPFEVARSHLIRRILELPVPRNPGSFWMADDFELMAEHIKEAATLFDEWLQRVAFQVSDNSPHSVDERSFDDVFVTGADSAIYECSNVAERMRDDRRAA